MTAMSGKKQEKQPKQVSLFSFIKTRSELEKAGGKQSEKKDGAFELNNKTYVFQPDLKLDPAAQADIERRQALRRGT
jgi:hypothetical protein